MSLNKLVVSSQLILGIIVTVGTMPGVARCAATIYYVDPAGDDVHNSGTSSTDAFETIQKAIDMCTPSTDPYIIRIKGDETYVPAVQINTGYWDTVRGARYFFAIDGKSDITIEPTAGTGTPILDGDLNASGNATKPHNSSGTETTRETGLLLIEDCNNITIRGLKITNSGQVGIMVMETRDTIGSGEVKTQNITIEDCVVDGTWSWGILVQGKTPTGAVDVQPYNITVRDNTIKNVCKAVKTLGVGNASGEALRIYNTDTFYVYGNYIFDHYKEGIDVLASAENGDVYDNLIEARNPLTNYGSAGSSIYIDGSANINTVTTQSIRVFGNIISGDGVNEGIGIAIASEAGGDVNGVDIYNNVVSLPSSACFCVCGDVNNGTNSGEQKNIRVFNNTFVGDTDQYVVILHGADEDLTTTKYTGFEFKNNIVSRVTDDPDLPLIDNPLDIGGIDTNLFWDDSADVDGEVGTNSVVADPDFVTETLTIASQSYSCVYSINGSYPYSPAFEAGIDLSSSGVVDDIRGAYRPDGTTHDIGAFEVPH